MKHGEKADASIPNRGTGRQGGTLELFACCLFGACARKKSGRVKTGMRNTNPKQQKTKKKAPEFSLNRFSFCGCGCGCICAACCGANVSMCVCVKERESACVQDRRKGRKEEAPNTRRKRRRQRCKQCFYLQLFTDKCNKSVKQTAETGWGGGP